MTINVKTQSSAKNGTHQKWLHEALQDNEGGALSLLEDDIDL